MFKVGEGVEGLGVGRWAQLEWVGLYVFVVASLAVTITSAFVNTIDGDTFHGNHLEIR